MKPHKTLSGQALLEFVVILPLALLLMMGSFDIGRAVFYYATLNTAVRTGNRFAIVQSDCRYRSDPGGCTGGYLDSYPLACTDAASLANIDICNEIVNNFFSIGDLSTSTITIDHTLSITNDPAISINIEYLFTPVTPGIALFGDLTMHVNSQMLSSPIAQP